MSGDLAASPMMRQDQRLAAPLVRQEPTSLSLL